MQLPDFTLVNQSKNEQLEASLAKDLQDLLIRHGINPKVFVAMQININPEPKRRASAIIAALGDLISESLPGVDTMVVFNIPTDYLMTWSPVERLLFLQVVVAHIRDLLTKKEPKKLSYTVTEDAMNTHFIFDHMYDLPLKKLPRSEGIH